MNVPTHRKPPKTQKRGSTPARSSNDRYDAMAAQIDAINKELRIQFQRFVDIQQQLDIVRVNTGKIAALQAQIDHLAAKIRP